MVSSLHEAVITNKNISWSFGVESLSTLQIRFVVVLRIYDSKS